jgi:hypothetical protein
MDERRRKRGRICSAIGGASMVALAVMEAVEPWVFGQRNFENYRIWAIIALASLSVVFGLMFWWLRPLAER